MSEKIVRDFLTMWVTIEPIGSLALFIVLTSGMSREDRRKVALRATLYSALVLAGAIVLGQLILAAMDISLTSFQIAGGIVLFLFGLQMIFGRASDASNQAARELGHDIAVFPLAMPSIVGPESILAVILLTDNHIYPVESQLLTSAVVLVVLAITCVMLLSANIISRALGRAGSSILERLTGMILAGLAVEYVLTGLGIV